MAPGDVETWRVRSCAVGQVRICPVVPDAAGTGRSGVTRRLTGGRRPLPSSWLATSCVKSGERGPAIRRMALAPLRCCCQQRGWREDEAPAMTAWPTSSLTLGTTTSLPSLTPVMSPIALCRALHSDVAPSRVVPGRSRAASFRDSGRFHRYRRWAVTEARPLGPRNSSAHALWLNQPQIYRCGRYLAPLRRGCAAAAWAAPHCAMRQLSETWRLPGLRRRGPGIRASCPIRGDARRPAVAV